MPRFKYSPDKIRKAFSQKRIGGTAYFSLCGGGETLFVPELPNIISALLSEGHYVNVTTNGTHNKAFSAILKTIQRKDLVRLHFSFSLHYLELKRRKLLTDFVQNVHKISAAGCSFVVQLNLYDGYVPFLDEIKKFSIENFGALPQVAATRKEGKTIELYTGGSFRDYTNHGKSFDSPLFDFTIQNFNKCRREFCYAGAWSYVANIAEGWIKPCYCNGKKIDIFADMDKPFPRRPVGHCCHHKYCVNSSHFLSLGVIPDLYDKISYAALRNRANAQWYSNDMNTFLSSKLTHSNEQMGLFKRMSADIVNIFTDLTQKATHITQRLCEIAHLSKSAL